mmetsp:Transcript_13951/g.34368  ORF Transcript_13951/g.34368 Transcript_13951/m.34368 type:complete len:431 (-) Transcript_13951:289-1581(-)
MGRRPCSSAMRSPGLAEWNAPEQMNRMWSVLTVPCLVCTAEPSMMGSRSRCTPCELGSPVRQGELRELTILSISSMNTMPSCSVSRTASLATTSAGNSRSTSASSSAARASLTVSRLRSTLRAPAISRSRLMTSGDCWPCIMLPRSRPGLAGSSTSTIAPSSSPAASRARSPSSALGTGVVGKPGAAAHCAAATAPSGPAMPLDASWRRMVCSTASAMAACACSLSLLLTRPMAASTRSLMMESTSRPWYPTSVNLVASTLMKGASASLASRRAISVLPHPVGPIMRMFLGVISSRSSPATRWRRHRLRNATATAFLASPCPIMKRSRRSTTAAGVSLASASPGRSSGAPAVLAALLVLATLPAWPAPLLVLLGPDAPALPLSEPLPPGALGVLYTLVCRCMGRRLDGLCAWLKPQPGAALSPKLAHGDC